MEVMRVKTLKSIEDFIGLYDVDGTPVEVRPAPPDSGAVLECVAYDTPEPRPFNLITVLKQHGVPIDQARFDYLKADARSR